MKLLILKEKHGARYFGFDTEEEFLRMAHKIVHERIIEGFYEGADKRIGALVTKVIQNDDSAASGRILQIRSDARYEYEEIEIEELQQAKDMV
jgi:hypothetical protein